MKLINETEVRNFIQTIHACKRDVYLMSPDGQTTNLKSALSLYAGIGCLLGENGDSMELFADCREDEARLLGFLCAVDRARHIAA